MDQQLEDYEKNLPITRYTLTFWDYELGRYVEWHSYRSARHALAVAARYLRICMGVATADIRYGGEDLLGSLQTPSPANNEFIYVGYQVFGCTDSRLIIRKFYKTFLIWRLVKTTF
ncbi:MAG TPA: hypothetical protein VLE93_00715 [Candidatus Saccharimonadales bacterium]|nr:hypothetical protein [Candidatus Saccharimonadales bacterium]